MFCRKETLHFVAEATSSHFKFSFFQHVELQRRNFRTGAYLVMHAASFYNGNNTFAPLKAVNRKELNISNVLLIITCAVGDESRFPLRLFFFSTRRELS